MPHSRIQLRSNGRRFQAAIITAGCDFVEKSARTIDGWERPLGIDSRHNLFVSGVPRIVESWPHGKMSSARQSTLRASKFDMANRPY